jgi:hypothetical protein
MVAQVSLKQALVHAIAHELVHYKSLKDKLCTARKERWLGLVQERVNSRERLASLRGRLARLP